MPLQILVSGAGIAGPAAAFWFSRLGHACTIIERFPNIRNSGLQIDLRGQGVAAVKKMGLLDQVYESSVDEAGTRLVNSKGEVVAMDARHEKDDEREQSFSSAFEIMRCDLLQILSNTNKGRVEYRFDLTVTSYENIGDKVKVDLSDGSSETYDLLIAADGQGSRIRRQMFEHHPERDTSKSIGVFCGYYTLPRETEDSSLATFYHAPGARMILTRFHTKENGQAYINSRSNGDILRPALQGDVAEQKAAFTATFKGMGWQEERILKQLNEADDFYCEEMTQRRSSTWSDGRVVLLGDAAYCATPISGMGTSLAFIGAYVLAGELSKHGDDVIAGLAGYEKSMRPCAEEAQKLPPGMPNCWIPETATGVKVLHTAAALANTSIGSWFVEKAFRLVAAGTYSWRLPEYPKLEGVNERSPMKSSKNL